MYVCMCVYLPETLLCLAVSSSSTVHLYPPVIKHGNGTSPPIDEFIIKTSIWPVDFQIYLMEGKLPISYHEPTINQWERQDPKMQVLYYYFRAYVL